MSVPFWKEDASLETKAKAFVPAFVRAIPTGVMNSCATFGNLAHESAEFKALQEIEPTVKGSRGGYGWAQWTASRRDAYMKWCRDNSLAPSSHEANFRFLVYELTETWEKRVIPAMDAQTTLEAKTRVFMEKFERPGVPHLDRRIEYARRAYAAVTAGTEGQTAPKDNTVPVAEGIIVAGGGILATAGRVANDTLWWIGLGVVVLGGIWLLWRAKIPHKLFRALTQRKGE